MVFLSSSGRKECKMEKTIEKFLVAHGYKTETMTQRTSAREIRGMSTEHYGDWFNQKVLGLDSEEYRRAFWHEVSTTGHTIGHVPRTLKTLLRDHHVARGSETCGVLLALAIVQGGICPFWFISRYLSRRITRMRRSGYYARERERRYRLADERRSIRIRRTANPCPSINEIREAWSVVQATQKRGCRSTHNHALAILRLGALLEDLECYVDNHAYVTRGVPGIRGRAPGIKGFFANKAPDLFEHYKSIMRGKALAKRFRQACGGFDPIPVNALLPVPGTVLPNHQNAKKDRLIPISINHARRDDPSPAHRDFATERSATPTKGLRIINGIAFPTFPYLEDPEALRTWMRTQGNTEYLKTQCRSTWSFTNNDTGKQYLRTETLIKAARIIQFHDGSLVALEAAIALEIAPSCTMNAVKTQRRRRGTLDGHSLFRVSKRIRNWLARHQCLMQPATT